ncbi:MAG: beta-1,6-N-acetylglucosaminyltransferase [Acidiferrobacterales bacterium]|nr:beta-1,6-N-acetylglucosaminyltransferase [Acidiferrobacterales bacterium]
MTQKKIAFCFQTYGDIHQGAAWKKFFAGNQERFNLYVHNKLPMQDSYFSDHIIDNVIETRYGSITQLKASINLFEAAWENPENAFLILVSGSCVPLQTFDAIYREIVSLDATLFKLLNPQLGRLKFMLDKAKFNSETFKTQSTWMVMKREDLPVILKNDMTDTVFGPRVFGVDHHYYINLFGLFDMEYKEYPVTWDNWAEPDVRKNPYHYGPKTYETLDEATIATARSEGSFFMRKVSENCVLSDEFVNSIS